MQVSKFTIKTPPNESDFRREKIFIENPHFSSFYFANSLFFVILLMVVYALSFLGGYTKMNGVQKGMVFKVGNNLSTRKGENRETIVSWLGLSLLVGLVFILFSLFHQPMISQANEPTQEKHFMVYYRAWRDKTMQGVNTTLPDENWLTMHDIPYGIDIVNVFSYVPKGQEALAQPFYDTLKNEYAPALHARGVRLVRGIDYSELLKVPYAGTTPTEAERVVNQICR